MGLDLQPGAVLTIEPTAEALVNAPIFEQGGDLHLQFEWWDDVCTDSTVLPCSITFNASWILREHDLSVEDDDICTRTAAERKAAWDEYLNEASARAYARKNDADGRGELAAFEVKTDSYPSAQAAWPLEHLPSLSPGIDRRLAERSGITAFALESITTRQQRDAYFARRCAYEHPFVIKPRYFVDADPVEVATHNEFMWRLRRLFRFSNPELFPQLGTRYLLDKQEAIAITKRIDRKLWDVSEKELSNRFASEEFLHWYIRFDQLPLRTLHDGIVSTYDLALRPWIRAQKDHAWHLAVHEGKDPNYSNDHISDGVVHGSGKFIDKSTTCEIGQAHEEILWFAESFQDVDMFITSTPGENRERIQRDRAGLRRLWNRHLERVYPPSFQSKDLQWDLERIFGDADAIEHRIAAAIQVSAWDQAHKRAKRSSAFKQWDKQMDEFFRPKNQGRYRKNKVLPATPIDCLWLLQLMLYADIFIPAPSHIAKELEKIFRRPSASEIEPKLIKELWNAWKSRQINELIAAAQENRKPHLISKSKWLLEEDEDEDKQLEIELEKETLDLRFGGDEFRPSIPATASDEVFRNEDDRAPNLADQQGDYVEHFGWRENDPVDVAALKAQLIAKDEARELTRQDAITYVEKISNIPGAQTAAYQAVKPATARQRKSRRSRMLKKDVIEVPIIGVNGNFQKYIQVIPADLMAALQRSGGYVAFIKLDRRPLKAYPLNVDGVKNRPALMGSGFSPVDVAFFATCLPIERNALRKIPARRKQKKVKSLEDSFDRATVLHFQCDSP